MLALHIVKNEGNQNFKHEKSRDTHRKRGNESKFLLR